MWHRWQFLCGRKSPRFFLISDFTFFMSARIPYHDMTEAARLKLEAFESACVKMESARLAGGKVRALSAQYARDLCEHGWKISAERMRKNFDAWRKRGAKALIDLRLCGGSLTKRQMSNSKIPPRVLQQWHAERLRRADKDKDAGAWRWLMTKLITGDEIEGFGTWHRLWFDLYPHAEQPEACPWNYHKAPPGWSLASFRKQPAPSEMVEAMATQGYGKARSIASRVAGVNIDWSTLRPMELIAFDDVRLDFSVIVWHNGKPQVVPLVLLVARDVATRRVLGIAVRSRVIEDDGVRRHIRRRDMQHLTAGVLYAHGLPRDYNVKLLTENSTAVHTSEFEPVLHRATDGRVTIDRTGLFERAVRIGGFFETGGAPNAKAIQESSFKLLHNELANVRGQMGRNYTVRPGEHDGRVAETLRMLNAPNGGALINVDERGDVALKVKLPFPDLWESHRLIHEALRRIDARTMHDLEGFLEITEFRFSEGDPVYRPLHPAVFDFQRPEIKKDIALFGSNEVTDALRNRWLSYGRTRKESPAERWLRLVSGEPFLKLSKESLFELFMDVSKPFEYNGANSVRLEILGSKIEFRGRDHDLIAGCKYSARFNADNPALIYLQDSAGRVLGTMDRVDRLDWHDIDGRKAAMEAQAIEIAHAEREVRTLQMSHPDALAELRDREAALHLLNPHAGESPETSGHVMPKGDLAAVATSGKRTRKKAAEDDAELIRRMIEAGG